MKRGTGRVPFRLWARGGAWLLACVVLAACTSKAEPPIRVGTNSWPGYEPLYLARDTGLLDPEKVDLKRMRSTTEVMAAFGEHRVDAAAVTLDEAILLLAAGHDPRVVLVMDTSNGGDAVIGHPGLRSMRDLKGLRLGVEKTALGAYMATRALQSAGLSLKDVTVVNLPADRHAAAFLGDSVDAVVTFEPMKSALLLAGGVELFNSARIPGEIVDVLVVNRDFAAKHPGRVRTLLAGWFDALAFMKADPDKAYAQIGFRQHLAAGAVQKSYEGLDLPGLEANLRLVIGNGTVPGLASAATRLSETMHAMDIIKGDVKPMRLFTPADAMHPLFGVREGRRS
jgi:NitT/TauT family transport system substrate-binding protein